jgi:hypothetical protein
VAASAGLSGLSNGNVVRIVRLAPGGAVQELELRPADWEPSDPQWLDASTIQLRQQAPLTGETWAFSKSIELVRIRGEWQLREKPVP